LEKKEGNFKEVNKKEKKSLLLDLAIPEKKSE